MLAAPKRSMHELTPSVREVGWEQPSDHECQGEEMQQSQDIHMPLVDRIDQPKYRPWYVGFKRMNLPTQRNRILDRQNVQNGKSR